MAYTNAKEYMALQRDPDFPDVVSDELTEKEYTRAKAQFPNLEELPIAETNQDGYNFYARNAMVQALWKVAAQGFFRFCQEREWIVKNPASALRAPKVTPLSNDAIHTGRDAADSGSDR